MRGLTVCILCAGSFILGCTITINLIILEDQASRSLTKQNKPSESLPQRSQILLNILILSSPNNVKQRNTMRETWLSLLEKNEKYYFVLGMNGADIDIENKIHQESVDKNDLLLLKDVEDNYNTLTHKVVSALSAINSTDFKYLLKCDDDTYVSTKRFVHELKTFESSGDSLYWGFFKGDAKVKARGQWKETHWNLCDTYLPYALGGGYVLSRDLVTYIVNNKNRLRYFNSEDVSIGSWLAPLNTNRRHDNRFNTEYRSRGCRNSYLVMHKQDPQDMKVLHFNLMNYGRLCAVERSFAPSYEYNWNVLPSLCCIKKNIP